MKEEILDIVDIDENVIGQIARNDSYRVATEKLGYIRVADLFLINSSGKIWVPIRTADKVIAPNGYDFSVGGHVESGDNYIQTLIREAKEEINLDIDKKDIEFISNVTYEENGYKQNIYLFKTDATPEFNPNDFISAEWLTPAELIKSIDNGHKTKSNLRSSVMLLVEYLGQAK
jgi:isopentenyl-diphosphate delta-isomerase